MYPEKIKVKLIMCLLFVRNWLYTIIVHCIYWSCSKHNLMLQHATVFLQIEMEIVRSTRFLHTTHMQTDMQ